MGLTREASPKLRVAKKPFSVRLRGSKRCSPRIAHASSIEYGQRYRVVPGAAVASIGPVASVALFSKKPATAVRTIALDSSSRTSITLTRILCAEWFDIKPEFVTMNPHLPAVHECWISRRKGGTDHLEKLQLMCSNCNRIKGDRGMAYLQTKLQLAA